MNNNIVKFPNDYVPPEQETLSDLKKNIKKNKEIYVNNVVDQHSSNLLANISLSGFDIDKDWLDNLALSTQVVIKKSKLNYQHGKILYATLRNFIEKYKYQNLTVFETGTSRGFSSICMSKAINDSHISGKIISQRRSEKN